MANPTATPRLRGRLAVAERLRYLKAHPLCRMCKERGVTSPATAVDHIVPLFKGGPDTDSNKQSLCAECHRDKTELDMGRRPVRRVGADGYPIEE